jgi:hypothetical protein
MRDSATSHEVFFSIDLAIAVCFPLPYSSFCSSCQSKTVSSSADSLSLQSFNPFHPNPTKTKPSTSSHPISRVHLYIFLAIPPLTLIPDSSHTSISHLDLKHPTNLVTSTPTRRARPDRSTLRRRSALRLLAQIRLSAQTRRPGPLSTSTTTAETPTQETHATRATGSASSAAEMAMPASLYQNRPSEGGGHLL